MKKNTLTHFTEMKVNDLPSIQMPSVPMQFKLTGMRKTRQLKSIRFLTGDKLAPNHIGKILLIDEKCKQYVMNSSDLIMVLTNK
jgi:hypothetical protein